MDLEKVNLNLLVALRHLLEERNVTRAAGNMHITQSAMSKCLSQLRDLFQDPLLVRVGNQLHPTNKAKQLQGDLRDILGDIHRILMSTNFEPFECQQKFTLAASDYVVQYILPSVLDKLLRKAPQIKIDIRLWEPNSMQLLQSGKIDMAACILDQFPSDIQGNKIDEAGFVCMMRQQHPLAQKKLTMEDYITYAHAVVTTGGDKVVVIDKVLSKLGYKRKIKLSVPFISSAMQMTAQTDLLLTLPRHMADSIGKEYGLTYRALPFAVKPTEYFLIWHQRSQQDDAHKFVREITFSTLQQSIYSH